VRRLDFEEVIRDVSAGNVKVQKGEYLSSGKYPIIDQGQDFIGGFTNDAASLVAGEGPWIVFGDHTRALKFVELPFCMGADGVKVLTLKDEKVADLKYVHHFLQFANIPSAGYSRHYKFLKRLEIPLPPLDEQKRIAAILDKADQLRQKRRQAMALLDSLTQSIFLEMFGDPVSNPRGFPHVPLSDLIDPKDRLNYGVVQPGDTLEGGVPLIRVSDLRNGVVDRSALKHIDPRISSKHSKSVLNGREILVSCVGSIGEIAVASDADRGSNVARAVARIPLKNGVSRAFVAAYLRTDAVQNYFTKELRTVSQPTLNIKQISETLIPLVAPEETNRFEDKLSRHQKLKKTQDLQLHETEALFHSLQHRAFSGQL